MKIAREQIRYETIEPSVSAFADRAAFSFSSEYSILTGHVDIIGAIFIRIEDRGRLVRKLVNMPDGMLFISRTFNYHIVEP